MEESESPSPNTQISSASNSESAETTTEAISTEGSSEATSKTPGETSSKEEKVDLDSADSRVTEKAEGSDQAGN